VGSITASVQTRPAQVTGKLERVKLASLPALRLDRARVGGLAEVDWYWVVRAADLILSASAAPGPPGTGSETQAWILAEALLEADEAPHAAALILEPIRVVGRDIYGFYLDGRRRVAAMRAQGIEACIAAIEPDPYQ
jgi:hypothetical protein